MSILAIVSVKDEVELIRESLLHLIRIGVDEIVVCDKGSTDGTREVLASCSEIACVVEVPDAETHDEWAVRCLAIIERSRVDWVTFLDADEFVVTPTGRLADCAAFATADIIVMDRYNVPATLRGACVPDDLAPERYTDLLVVADPHRDFWRSLDEEPEASWMCSRVAPRVLARPCCIGRIGYGAHNVFPPAAVEPHRVCAHDAFVAHVPTTTWERFSRKVENIRAFLLLHGESFGPGRALHWRRWVAQADIGLLRTEFDRLLFSDDTIVELRARRVIRSAADLFDAASTLDVRSRPA